MTKRLYRSKQNKVLAGICGGIGAYFDVDPVLIRLIYLLFTIGTGLVPGALVYFIAILIVPEAPHSTPSKASDDAQQV